MIALDFITQYLSQLLCRSKPHDLSFAQIKSEPAGIHTGLDIDETCIEKIGRDQASAGGMHRYSCKLSAFVNSL